MPRPYNRKQKIRGIKLGILMGFVVLTAVGICYFQFGSLIMGIAIGLPVSMWFAIYIGNSSGGQRQYTHDESSD